MDNTRDILGDKETLSALLGGTLEELIEDGVDELRPCAIKNNPGIKKVILPNCKKIGEDALEWCDNLEYVELPCCDYFGRTCCYHDTKLEKVKIGPINALKSIGDMCWEYNYSLKHFIFDCRTVPTSSIIGSRTPIRYQEGAVYVPDDLVDNYKNSNYFSNLIIEPISNYPRTNFDTIADTWEEINQAMIDGSYKTKYSIGDTKTFYIGETLAYAKIVAFDADELADEEGTAPITWIAKQCYPDDRDLATSSTVKNYLHCGLKQYLRDNILPQVNISEYIVPVIKTGYCYATQKTETTIDELWIPSVRELWNGDSGSNEDEGAIYSEVFHDADSRIAKKNYSDCTYWLRSIDTSQDAKTYVTSKGAYGKTTAGTSYSVWFGFCTKPNKHSKIITDSWEEIIASEQDGTYLTKYRVGDKKTITIGENTYEVAIAGIDKDTAANSAQKAHITWFTTECIGNHAFSTNLPHNWSESTLRTYLNDTVLETIDIKSKIVPVKKTYRYYTNSSNNGENSCDDYLWIPSVREIYGNYVSGYEENGCDYTTYFGNYQGSYINYNGTPVKWWTRSQKPTNPDHCNIQNYENFYLSTNGVTAQYGIVLGFCT